MGGVHDRRQYVRRGHRPVSNGTQTLLTIFSTPITGQSKTQTNVHGSGVVQGSHLKPITGGYRNQSLRWHIVGLALLSGQYADGNGYIAPTPRPEQGRIRTSDRCRGQGHQSRRKPSGGGSVRAGPGTGAAAGQPSSIQKQCIVSCLHATLGQDCYHSARKYKEGLDTTVIPRRNGKYYWGSGTDIRIIYSLLR